MAIWQWDVCIVPSSKVAQRFGGIPESLDLDQFEATNWWKTLPPAPYIEFFSRVLPHYETPWAKYSRSWGSDAGNRITLMIEDDVITDVVIRVDLRQLDYEFLNALIEFSRANGFLFYAIESNRFIEPKLPQLLSEIGSSRKMSFIQNPREFFESNKAFLEEVNESNLRKADNR